MTARYLTDPNDFVSVDPTDDGRWQVTVWTIDGMGEPIGPPLSRGTAEAMYQNIRDAFATWVAA